MTELKDHPSSDPGEARMPRYLGATVKSIASESYGWHSHGWGQLISAASGSMYIGTPDRVLLLSPAMILWVPPDVEHWMRYGPNNELRYVDARRDEAREIGTDCRIIAMTPLLKALMAETVPREGSGQGGGRANGHDDALHDLLRHELAAAPDVPLSITLPRDPRIRRFAESALDDPGVIESVETWLADAPASRKTVERLFIAETGMPPSRWLRHARLFHAISRLSAGEKVSSVAFDMGYASSSAFSYMFRRSLGRSPSEFCI
ncbi:helix-turn-helix domain-containing protein [Pelagibius sp. Alg239-R121]|uniref:AraC family transcriptional regulator n=1 Tax=Pelagibius sp. Alg239-R121 TaxID=2993448 RepID=UPI0024A60D5F|nr:helix-turn-helix transcriptional regulator [Pelagibius sp. Alg239-R121]